MSDKQETGRDRAGGPQHVSVSLVLEPPLHRLLREADVFSVDNAHGRLGATVGRQGGASKYGLDEPSLLGLWREREAKLPSTCHCSSSSLSSEGRTPTVPRMHGTLPGHQNQCRRAKQAKKAERAWRARRARLSRNSQTLARAATRSDRLSYSCSHFKVQRRCLVPSPAGR